MGRRDLTRRAGGKVGRSGARERDGGAFVKTGGRAGGSAGFNRR